MINQELLYKTKVLIVDDNPTNVLLLQTILENSGYTNIVTETDSRKVLDLYRTIKPDILLLDLRMPHLDGFEIIQQLKQANIDDYVPIVVVTAHNDRDLRIKALDLGAKDFVGKPYDQIEILLRIRNLLETRLLHNRMNQYNNSLEHQVRERTQDMKQIQLEVIRRLGIALEFRDHDTGNHIIRMSLYTAEIARAAGFSEEYCQLLMNASSMHDIGKIGVPDQILLKSSKLTEEEWTIMRMHPIIGEKILAGSQSKLLQTAETIALTHHEKWDGTGYPYGLKGEEIPLVGRITAIADVFDALTSDRPYKPTWPIKDAIEEIKRCRSSHFDARLVDHFLNLMPNIISIKEEFKDDVTKKYTIEE